MRIKTYKTTSLLIASLAFSACGQEDKPVASDTESETASDVDNEIDDIDTCMANIVAPDSETDISQIPWQVALVDQESQFCGGAIIDESWVLTALHCVLEEGSQESIRVRAGITRLSALSDPNLQERKIEEVFRYPGGLQGGSLGGDIALIRLETPLDLNETTTQAIDIATPEDEQFFPPGTPATASGWGVTVSDLDVENCGASPFSDVLRATTISSITRQRAISIIDEIKAIEDAEIIEEGGTVEEEGSLRDLDITIEMIATDSGELGLTTCQGDSGGPLTVSSPRGPLLVGLTSWGLACGIPNVPVFYTRVAWFSDWILSTMNPDSPEFDPSDRSCVSLNSCGDITPSGCSCDASCQQTGDCCLDYRLACTENPPDFSDFL